MTAGIRAHFKEGVSIVLCGEAGQGVQTVEHLLTSLAKLSGYHVFAGQEYMSRIRGGNNSTLLRVSSRRVSAFVDRIDLLVPFSPGSVNVIHIKRDGRTIHQLLIPVARTKNLEELASWKLKDPYHPFIVAHEHFEPVLDHVCCAR